MVIRRFVARIAHAPVLADYLVALAMAGLAALGRVALEPLMPGGAAFVTLFPAIALAGVLCGTAPAAVGAVAGGALIAVLVFGRALLVWPPFGAEPIELLSLAIGSAAVLWATGILRRHAAEATATQARLAETFRQIPGAAAILAAPEGRLLLRSAQSGDILDQPERPLQRSAELASYGGIHPDGSRLAADDYPIVRALRTGEVVRGEPLRYRRPDGRVIDLDVHAGPVRGPDGAIVAAVGMAFDISDKVAAERRLQETAALHRATAERLQAALGAGALGLWEVDLATQGITLDGVLAGMLGLPPKPITLSREQMRRFVDPADAPRVAARFDAALAAGGMYADELRMVTAWQQTGWFIVRGRVLCADGKMVGVMSDVTDRHEREAALQAALAAREVLMREADHRIKNSLQLVVSLLRLQLGRVTDADARAALSDAVARVHAVADVHLALQQSADLRSIEVDQMLEDLCRRVGTLNPAVTVGCDTRVGLVIDAEQAIPLGLLASELLTNALRHAYPAGTAGTVTLTAVADADSLELTIADGGVGMPAEPARTGLGTSVIRTLARQIGAAVSVDTAPACGTRVSVRLNVPGAANREPRQLDNATA